jgi:hypothetical protein
VYYVVLFFVAFKKREFPPLSFVMLPPPEIVLSQHHLVFNHVVIHQDITSSREKGESREKQREIGVSWRESP